MSSLDPDQGQGTLVVYPEGGEIMVGPVNDVSVDVAMKYLPYEGMSLTDRSERTYDLFVRQHGARGANIKEWKYASTHRSAGSAWTGMNYVRRTCPQMDVRIMSRPNPLGCV